MHQKSIGSCIFNSLNCTYLLLLEVNADASTCTLSAIKMTSTISVDYDIAIGIDNFLNRRTQAVWVFMQVLQRLKKYVLLIQSE